MKGVRRGFLKYYILKLLSEGNYSGYGLIKEIEEETGFWEPSTGSVYPLLESLEDEGLIAGEGTDRGNSWKITPRGEEAYEEASEAKKKMKESIKQSMIVFSRIFNEEQIEEVADRIDEGLMPACVTGCTTHAIDLVKKEKKAKKKEAAREQAG